MVQPSTARRRDLCSRSLGPGCGAATSPPTSPSSSGRGDLLQECKSIENAPDPPGHAGHRVLGNRHGKLSFPLGQLVQPPKEATTACEDDARIDDVRGQFWG